MKKFTQLKSKAKGILVTGLMLTMATFALAGCGGGDDYGSTDNNQGGTDAAFKSENKISVVSREDGSGTRGAFTELFDLILKDDAGNKKDLTSKEAIIVNKTDVMLTNIAGNPYAVGYVSLGSLNDTVKALNIDGVAATAENVKNGTYKISRPFNVVTKAQVSDVAQDFLNFILSAEGQGVVAESYVSVDDAAPAYAGTKPSGKVVIAGSSSVSPIMEKLKEAYIAINPNASIEIQTSDSTAGVTGTVDGICDIGMVSRELKDSEKEQLQSTVIALDGIAVIVNPTNPLTDATSANIKDVFTGTITLWNGIK